MFRRILFVGLFFTLLTAIILFARGYRFNIEKREIVPSGIAIVSSYPTGAQIFINGELKGATNYNITLEAGIYNIELRKEGYSTWKDEISVKGEIVTKIDALLFPLNPSLIPITSVGVKRAYWSENGDRIIVYSYSEEDNEKDGLYFLDTSKRTLSIFNPMRMLIADSILPQGFAHEDLFIEFAPDSRDILVEIKGTAAYLIPTDIETTNPIDVLRSVDVIRSRWEELRIAKTKRLLEVLKEPVQKVASESFKFISYSLDETKFIYTVKNNVDLPRMIDPPLIGSNSSPEIRSLIKGDLYVYDIKEDKNYSLRLDNLNLKENDLKNLNITWYTDSQHIVIQKSKQIIIMNYDSKHSQTVYSGPFEEDFIAIAGDGRILILTNLNPDYNPSPDIYAVGIR